MELTIIDLLASVGGVGGFFGGLIFLIYRSDRAASERRLREDRKNMEDRLIGIIKEDQVSRANNTEALTSLKTVLTLLNGRIK